MSLDDSEVIIIRKYPRYLRKKQKINLKLNDSSINNDLPGLIVTPYRQNGFMDPYIAQNNKYVKGRRNVNVNNQNNPIKKNVDNKMIYRLPTPSDILKSKNITLPKAKNNERKINTRWGKNFVVEQEKNIDAKLTSKITSVKSSSNTSLDATRLFTTPKYISTASSDEIDNNCNYDNNVNEDETVVKTYNIATCAIDNDVNDAWSSYRKCESWQDKVHDIFSKQISLDCKKISLKNSIEIQECSNSDNKKPDHSSSLKDSNIENIDHISVLNDLQISNANDFYLGKLSETADKSLKGKHKSDSVCETFTDKMCAISHSCDMYFILKSSGSYSAFDESSSSLPIKNNSLNDHKIISVLDNTSTEQNKSIDPTVTPKDFEKINILLNDILEKVENISQYQFQIENSDDSTFMNRNSFEYVNEQSFTQSVNTKNLFEIIHNILQSIIEEIYKKTDLNFKINVNKNLLNNRDNSFERGDFKYMPNRITVATEENNYLLKKNSDESVIEENIVVNDFTYFNGEEIIKESELSQRFSLIEEKSENIRSTLYQCKSKKEDISEDNCKLDFPFSFNISHQKDTDRFKKKMQQRSVQNPMHSWDPSTICKILLPFNFLIIELKVNNFPLFLTLNSLQFQVRNPNDFMRLELGKQIKKENNFIVNSNSQIKSILPFKKNSLPELYLSNMTNINFKKNCENTMKSLQLQENCDQILDVTVYLQNKCSFCDKQCNEHTKIMKDCEANEEKIKSSNLITWAELAKCDTPISESTTNNFINLMYEVDSLNDANSIASFDTFESCCSLAKEHLYDFSTDVDLMSDEFNLDKKDSNYFASSSSSATFEDRCNFAKKRRRKYPNVLTFPDEHNFTIHKKKVEYYETIEYTKDSNDYHTVKTSCVKLPKINNYNTSRNSNKNKRNWNYQFASFNSPNFEDYTSLSRNRNKKLEKHQYQRRSRLPKPVKLPPLVFREKDRNGIPDASDEQPESVDNKESGDKKSMGHAIDSAYSSLTRVLSEGDSTKAEQSRFCHECGTQYPVALAKFCCYCGMRRIAI